MTRLARPLKDFLAEQEWTEEVTEEGADGFAQLAVRLLVANQSCRLYVDARDENDSVAAFCYLPFNALPGNLVQTCVLLNGLNRRMRFAHAEVDPEDGELRILAAARFDGLEVTGRHVDDLVEACLGPAGHWMGVIAEVALAGRPAQEALAAFDAAKAAVSD